MYNIDSKAIYKKIDLEREKQNLTVYELSKRACISDSTIYNWRDKASTPTIPLLENLCEVLKIPLISLFLNDEQNEVFNLWNKFNDTQRKALLTFLKEMN